MPYQFNEKDLLENHLSQLKFLLDYEDFVDVVSTLYPDFNMESLKQRYEETKKNGIQAIGVRCYVKRDDLLNMIEKDGLEYLRIRDIKLSILQG